MGSKARKKEDGGNLGGEVVFVGGEAVGPVYQGKPGSSDAVLGRVDGGWVKARAQVRASGTLATSPGLSALKFSPPFSLRALAHTAPFTWHAISALLWLECSSAML